MSAPVVPIDPFLGSHKGVADEDRATILQRLRVKDANDLFATKATYRSEHTGKRCWVRPCKPCQVGKRECVVDGGSGCKDCNGHACNCDGNLPQGRMLAEIIDLEHAMARANPPGGLWQAVSVGQGPATQSAKTWFRLHDLPVPSEEMMKDEENRRALFKMARLVNSTEWRAELNQAVHMAHNRRWATAAFPTTGTSRSSTPDMEELNKEEEEASHLEAKCPGYDDRVHKSRRRLKMEAANLNKAPKPSASSNNNTAAAAQAIFDKYNVEIASDEDGSLDLWSDDGGEGSSSSEEDVDGNRAAASKSLAAKRKAHSGAKGKKPASRLQQDDEYDDDDEEEDEEEETGNDDEGDATYQTQQASSSSSASMGPTKGGTKGGKKRKQAVTDDEQDGGSSSPATHKRPPRTAALKRKAAGYR